MTKLNEFHGDDFAAKVKYVETQWSWIDQGRSSALSRITNYLFILNTGGLLGALTYVASKEATDGIQLSIVFFSWGITFIVGHAALDYYWIESGYAKVTQRISDLYELKLCWDDFLKEVRTEENSDLHLHILGWSSALCFFLGLIVGITQVQ